MRDAAGHHEDDAGDWRLPPGTSEEALYAVWIAKNFEGIEWHSYATNLLNYAAGTLHNLITTGRIWAELERIGCPRPHTPAHTIRLASDPDFLRELIRSSIAIALAHFVKRGREGRGWSPTGGRSIPTYLTEGALYAFAAEWRSYLAEEERRKHETTRAELPDRPDPSYDLASTVAGASGVEDILNRLTPGEQEIARLKSQGFTNKQIAEQLEKTPGGVASSLKRARQRLRGIEEDGSAAHV